MIEPQAAKDRKKRVYRWIKIGGLLSFLPFIMAAGPIGGYFIGDILEKKLGAPSWVTGLCIIIGFAGSAYETVKVIKVALQAEEKG
jgi:hypothetical protein